MCFRQKVCVPWCPVVVLSFCIGLCGCSSGTSEPVEVASSDDLQSNVSTDASHPMEPQSPLLESLKSSERTGVQLDETQAADVASTVNVDNEAVAANELEAQLAAYTIPPAWLSEVESSWDRSRPWQEARLEIRRLLGGNTEETRREALKLMWDYRQKNDIGNGHEYSMYTYLGQESLWAIIACREFLEKDDHQYAPTFALKSLATLYMEHGLYREAEAVLQRGLDWPPAEETWRRAEFLDSLGDLYVAWDKIDDARQHYREAIQLYPQTNPPYGQHLIPRRVKTIENKLDVLSLGSLEQVALQDGDWKATVLGYAEDIVVTARVEKGQLEEIRLNHDEKIDQGATIEIPKRIVEQQKLNVDGITGATVTKDAIVTGTLQALRQAGLK